MKFGTEERVEILDVDGSTKLTLTNYRYSEVTAPIRTRYKIKQQVASQKEEHEAYLKFSDEINNNRGMLDPCFEIERTKHGNLNGFYYVVKCYTLLSY